MAKRDILSESSESRYFTEYLTGDIHADFLDDSGAPDIHTTNREDFDHGSERYEDLMNFFENTLQKIAEKWDEYREEKKMKKVRKTDAWNDRIQHLPKHEKSLAEKYLKNLAGKENIDSDDMKKAADMVAENIEVRAFKDLKEDVLNSDVSDVDKLVELFSEWEIFDALETLRRAQGRIANILKFEELIEKGAKEIPDLHDFLVDNPWLLDPSWDFVDDEKSIRETIKDEFPEDEVSGRIDILCLSYGASLNVIELKRPTVALGRKELEQLSSYVDWLSEYISTESVNSDYKGVQGYLIGGHISQSRGVLDKKERLEKNGMYIRTYSKLKTIARNNFQRFIEVFKRKSERTEDKRLKQGLEKIREIGMKELELQD